MDSPTMPQTPRASPAPRLARCNAVLGAQVRKYIDLDAEGESPAATTSDSQDSASAASLVDFVVPDPPQHSAKTLAEMLADDTEDDPIEDEPEVLAKDSQAEKRSSPEPVHRMLLDEEQVDESQSREPPAKRATPAPAAAAAAPDNDVDPGEDVTNKANKYARWVWTWFHKDADYRPTTLPAGAEYLVYQEERCPTTGQLHLQGYIRYAKRLRWKQVVDQLQKDMPNASVRKAIKPELACIRYCTKKATRVTEGREIGQRSVAAGVQGHRSDLDSVIESCKAGKPLTLIAAENPGQYIKYHAGIEALHQKIGRDQKYITEWRPQITCSVLWGPTNTGKTHRVLSEHPGAYQVNPGRDPWGDYNGQDVIIFDEFNPKLWTIHQMNKFLDKYPLTLDARYHNNFAAWTKVYIIGNEPPSSWWREEPPMYRNALFRRLHAVTRITKRENDPDYDPELHCVPQAVPHDDE